MRELRRPARPGNRASQPSTSHALLRACNVRTAGRFEHRSSHALARRLAKRNTDVPIASSPSTTSSRTEAGRVSKFHPLPVAKIERETREAIAVTFDVPDALRGLFRFEPGQHLTLRTHLDGEGVR